jgi:gliding motility-associated-like protein
MMVVNASFEPGLFYEQQVDGLCGNTEYVFTADVYNLLLSNIDPNISFLLDNVEIYNTGDIRYSGSWETFGFTFTTAPEQTSVLLALQNNAPGGNGNDLALDNISFRACGPEALILPDEVANICEDGEPIDLVATVVGEQFDTVFIQWQQSFDAGTTWENIPNATTTDYPFTNLSGGMYYYRYVLANASSNLANPKCHVASNIKIVNVVPKFYTIIDTLCDGLAFNLADKMYDVSGVYIDSLTTYLGCDSIVTLELTIVPDSDISASFAATDPSCVVTVSVDDTDNATGSINNLAAGDYRYFFTDRYGCTFDTTINLQRPPPFTVDIGTDQQLKLGEKVRIDGNYSTPPVLFDWNSPDSVNCDLNCADLQWSPTQTTTLSLTATSEAGCIASDSINIEVLIVREDFVPNAFSPDADGRNDFFTIFANVPNVQEVEMLQIYDRWGGVIFEKQNFPPNTKNGGWDGTSRGQAVGAGIYAYFAQVRFLDGVVLDYVGEVNLVR